MKNEKEYEKMFVKLGLRKISFIAVILCLFFFFAVSNTVFADVYSSDIVALATQLLGYPYGSSSGPNSFDCIGLVKYVFGQYGISIPWSTSTVWNNYTNYGSEVSEANALPGDIVIWSGHAGIFVGNGQMINALNYDYGVCYTTITHYTNSSGVVNPPHKFVRIYGVNYGPKSGKLDVGGILDGTNNYSTGDYGTFDVYINNELKANDVNDYVNENLQDGSTYLIKDIKAKDGYSYDGTSQTFSGTITGGNTSIVWLPFNSCKLDVKGYLDKQISDTLGYYGTFDVYIDGLLEANDVNDFNQRVTKGSSYEIKDIKAKAGYRYENVYSGSLAGTIGSGTKTVTLSFIRIGELSCDWIETSTLPGNVTSENSEIQYNNHYQKSAASSPGSDWTRTGTGTTKYEATGQINEYLHQQTESNTLKYKGFYYFHYCGKSNQANYEYDASRGYTQYHNPGDPNNFDVVSEETDHDDPSLKYYKLSWKQPNQYNWTTAYCSDNTSTRSANYYRMYQYEIYNAVTYYTWVKDSGWTTSRDSSANSVTIRYRLKSGCGARDIVLPAGLKEIQSSAFEGSTAINEVTIPSGVTTIGSRAFANCTGLTLVRIPSSVTSIGSNAFLNDSNVVLLCQSNNTCVSYAQQNGISYRTQ